MKAILTCVCSPETAEAPVRVALDMAMAFDAQVTALHVRPDAASHVPFVGEGMSGAMVEDMIGMAEDECARRLEETRAKVEVLAADADGRLRFQAEDGLEDDVVARMARLADMVVLPMPREGQEIPSLVTVNTVLMDARRPALLVPLSMEAGALPPKNPVIAWNGSAEAARAVTNAMSLLKSVGKAHVVLPSADLDPLVDADRLEGYLAAHGVSMQRHLLPSRVKHIGAAVMDACDAAGGDFLVMGAYTHSALHRLILGGVTRYAMEAARYPLLMCH